MSAKACMNPHIGLTDEEYHPLETGEIEPLNRASALRALLQNQPPYPHCPRCHRALMFDGVCPTGDFSLKTSINPDMNWWATLKLRLTRVRA